MHRCRGQRRDEERAGGQHRPEKRATQHPGDEPPPRPVVARLAAEDGDTDAIDVVPEPVQHGGQHGERADHRGEDDDHRPDANRGEERVAGDEHAGHRDQHRRARDENGLAGRSRRMKERISGAPAPSPLLAFAAQVEERVVDPDGHADHEDDRAERLLIGRDDVTRERVETGRGEDGGECKNDRKAGRDERTEGDDEDRERQRQRRHLGTVHVGCEALVELVIRGGLAEFLDDQARVARLGLVDSGEDRRDLVLGVLGLPFDVELHEHRVAVGGDQTGIRMVDRRDDVRDRGLTCKRLDETRDRRCEGLVAEGRGVRLDEHALARRDLELRLVEDLLGAARLPVRDRPALHLARTDGSADDDGGHGERNPPERCALPVRCAPPTRAACEIRVHRRPPSAATVATSTVGRPRRGRTIRNY